MNTDFGGSVHIAFKTARDLLHYVHPPSFAIFWSAEKEGEQLHNFLECIALPLQRLQLGFQVLYRLQGLHQISISSTFN